MQGTEAGKKTVQNQYSHIPRLFVNKYRERYYVGRMYVD